MPNIFAWGDYTGDGKIDLILNTYDNVNESVISILYKNVSLALTPPAAISYTDTANNDTFSPQTATLSVTSTEVQTLTYGIDGGTVSDATVTKTGTYGTLILNTSTGEYTFTANDSAIEALTSNATENFEVTVSDGVGGSDSKTLTVNLTGANDKPIVSSATFSIQENSANGKVLGTVTGSDAEGSSLSNWTIVGGNTDVDGDTNLALAIDPTTGQITVNDSGDLDFETQATFNLQVTASDGSVSNNPTNITVNLLNLVEFTAGNDVGKGTANDDTMDARDGDDRIYGYGGNDSILLGIGADFGYGGDGNDSIDGGAGDDRFYGESGNDTLLGGAGADILYGGAGDDLLNGNLGNDRYYGEAGIDTFVIGSGQGVDGIYGYEIGIDKILVLGSSNIVEKKIGSNVLITSGTETLATIYNVALGQLSYIQPER